MPEMGVSEYTKAEVIAHLKEIKDEFPHNDMLDFYSRLAEEHWDLFLQVVHFLLLYDNSPEQDKQSSVLVLFSVKFADNPIRPTIAFPYDKYIEVEVIHIRDESIFKTHPVRVLKIFEKSCQEIKGMDSIMIHAIASSQPINNALIAAGYLQYGAVLHISHPSVIKRDAVEVHFVPPTLNLLRQIFPMHSDDVLTTMLTAHESAQGSDFAIVEFAPGFKAVVSIMLQKDLKLHPNIEIDIKYISGIQRVEDIQYCIDALVQFIGENELGKTIAVWYTDFTGFVDQLNENLMERKIYIKKVGAHTDWDAIDVDQE